MFGSLRPMMRLLVAIPSRDGSAELSIYNLASHIMAEARTISPIANNVKNRIASLIKRILAGTKAGY